MNITLFGGTGYLGSHTADQLSQAGHDVQCVVREGSDCDFLKTLPVQIKTADMSDQALLSGLMDEGGTVINCTADTRMHVSDQQRKVVEVELSSRLFLAAKQAGAKRFMQLSTVMIYGFDRPKTAIDEDFPVNPHYSYSRMAEQREQTLLALQKDSGVELIILRPSNTLGKRDQSALPALLASHQKGQFPVVGGGDWQYSCMDARDVGRAMVHLLNVEVSQPEVFLVKGYDTTWLDVKAAMDELLNRPSKLMNIPRGMAMAIGGIMEFLYPYGKNPPLTRFSAEVVSSHTLFDDRKIRQTGFAPQYDLRQTLTDALGL